MKIGKLPEPVQNFVTPLVGVWIEIGKTQKRGSTGRSGGRAGLRRS